MKPLAVTGAGAASSLGIGRSAFEPAIRAALLQVDPPVGGGRTRDMAEFDAKQYLGEKGLRSLDRLTKLLIVAARLGLHDAGWKRDGVWTAGDPERVGLVVSNAYGSLEAITELDRVATLEDARYINPSRFPLTVSNSAAGYASIWEDLRALNVSVSDGNCGALDAVACANVFFEQERADALLVGGAEALSEALSLAFDRLGALGDGAHLGEGAALLAIETEEGASRRGATVLSEILGYGTAFLAPESEASLTWASPRSVARAIAGALADAGVVASEVDLVVSGLSGLRPFDDAELAGIDEAVGPGPCVVAPKFAVGETLGAGGALAMLTAMALLDVPVGPRDRDEECAARSTPALAGATVGSGGHRSIVVRGALRGQARTALVTSLGYYGNASALVMRTPTR